MLGHKTGVAKRIQAFNQRLNILLPWTLAKSKCEGNHEKL